MNISSSISQVIYQTRLPGKILLNKAYLWPEYNAGNISRISSIQEKSDSVLNYVKRSSLDSINGTHIDKTQKMSEYGSNGNLVNTGHSYTPGSLFEALA